MVNECVESVNNLISVYSNFLLSLLLFNCIECQWKWSRFWKIYIS